LLAGDKARGGINGHSDEIDLLDASAVQAVVDRVRPKYVVHLAAIAFVAHGDVDAIYRTNIIGTRNLLAALEGNSGLRCVLLASSANIYGNALADPITESTPAQPVNDYAVSKLAMEFVAELWRERLPITVVRPFNYTGAGQSLNFLVPKIVDAYLRRATTIELGNLLVERDFSDVRDVVSAYCGLLQAAPGGVVNICSGHAYSLDAVLRIAQEVSEHALEVRVNSAFVRKNEVHRLCGSNERLRGLLPGWKPRPLLQTIEWMLHV
jgi:nucleoside-diphosphate-sugar epimerase